MELTLEEKCLLVTGKGMWHNNDLNGKIEAIHLSDGPHGVRAQEDGMQNNDSFEATCFPTASALACSFDPDLAAQMAKGIAAEAKELGVSIVLGPGVNIKRSPMCGRNFEYYSEDPFLAGEMVSAFIKAVQECGVGTSLKHYAGNSQETHRLMQNSAIDERALREIYLAAFEKAVKSAKPATIMASYNRVNGKFACENKHLLTDILRDEWGFEGLVMSDWGACSDLPACIAAGMDLEMPDSKGNHYDKLYQAVQDGTIPMEALDRAVEKVLAMVEAYGYGDAKPEKHEVSKDTRKANHKLAAQIATESAVLLKNDGFLPLKKDSKVLVVGDLARVIRYQGGGSSHIHTDHVSHLKKELEKCGIEAQFVRGYDANEIKRNKKLEASALAKVEEAIAEKMPILFFGGLTDKTEGEGYDRESYELPENQSSLLWHILELTGEVGFVSFGGSPYDMSLVKKSRAVLQMYLGGEAVAVACAKLLSGEANPCGKLPETYPVALEDTPCFGHYARQGEQVNQIDDVEYRESIFVGYRYYDTFEKQVQFPFGHGLSYTEFAYDDLRVEQQEGQVKVSFTVTNIGDRAGKEIAQVYVKNPKGAILRANKELRGFQKVSLEPGESKTVEIILDDRAFSVYADKTMETAGNGFVVVAGEYEIQVGSTSTDIRLKKTITIEGESIAAAFDFDQTIPLSKEAFEQVYTYEIKDFTHVKPGEFTHQNSLTQLAKVSVLGKIYKQIAKTSVRAMMMPKSGDDPEVKMMVEMVLDGTINSVCNMSGKLMSRETMQKIIDQANGKA